MRPSGTGRGGALPLVLSVVPFWLLATLNSAGYRYGASDQAFYVPAILARLHPAFFPRDHELIASQAHLTGIDEVMALLARLSGLSLPALLGVMYLASLALIAAGAWLIAARVYRSPWTGVALVAALTLRHAIARTGTNTLEGYFHPRQLAFGVGALALAALLRQQRLASLALVAVAACLHPTTAVWFAVWIGVACVVDDGRVRVPLALVALAGAMAAAWAVTLGPLAGRLVVMDPEWLATLSTKDYLFPLDWPLDVWLINLAYLPIILLLYRRRAAAGLVVRFETGLVAGCVALLLVFALSLPLNAARVALAVQFQVPRIFWMLDLLATIYAVWALAEWTAQASRRRAQITLAAILLASCARGGYVLIVRFPDRPIAQIGVADNDWGRAMAWTRTTPSGSGWLADPMHAVKYGTSVRVSGERDVFVEAVKDAAIGMYDRGVAIRTRDRLAALGDFRKLDAGLARTLAAKYDLDYLVTEGTLPLPVAFESGALRIYRLR